MLVTPHQVMQNRPHHRDGAVMKDGSQRLSMRPFRLAASFKNGAPNGGERVAMLFAGAIAAPTRFPCGAATSAVMEILEGI